MIKTSFLLYLLLPVSVAAQGPVSLDRAIELASARNEAVQIARLNLIRAQASSRTARSTQLPQLNASLNYTRTLASQFSGSFSSDTTSSTSTDPFVADTTATVADRIRALELALPNAGSSGGGFDLSNLPFGQKNAYVAGLSLSQSLYSGGRTGAQRRSAALAENGASIALKQAEASVKLDITRAYFDARLSDELLRIAATSLAQAESVLKQTELAFSVGDKPEFDALRARVSRDNARPAVLSAKRQRDQAYLRLAQLLGLDAHQPMVLNSVPDDSLLLRTVLTAPGDSSGASRLAVEAANANATALREATRISASGRLPQVNLTSQYNKLAYPGSVFPSLSSSNWRTDWTVGVAVSIPIFNGGRVSADLDAARAAQRIGELQLQQTRNSAELDTRDAWAALEEARLLLDASTGTVQQAKRAFDIAQVRYSEGISTQIELNDSRIALEQAEANRARAARDWRVALTRVQLLDVLPLSPANGFAGGL